MSAISGNISGLISVGASPFGGSEATGWIVSDNGSSSANSDPDLPSPETVE